MQGFIQDPNDDDQQIANSRISVTFSVGQNTDLFPTNSIREANEPQNTTYGGSSLTFTCNEDGCGFPADLEQICGNDGFLTDSDIEDYLNLEEGTGGSDNIQDLDEVIAYPANMEDFAPVDNVPEAPPEDAINLEELPSEGLPRNNDTPDNDGTYHYQIDDINPQQGNFNMTVDAGERVYLYVEGDITMGGDQEIQYDGDLGDFRIYGTGDNQDFTLSGTPGSGGAFIFAPEATVDLNGNAQFRGVLWVDEIDGTGNNEGFQTPENEEIENLIDRLDDDENFDFNRDAFEINEISSPPTSFQRLPVPPDDD